MRFSRLSPLTATRNMRIYLDTCSLNRPMDDKSQLRIALEAEAVLGILSGCESGRMQLISSEVLAVEVDRNPHPQKRAYVVAILEFSTELIPLNDELETRALILEKRGFKSFDALHIASAEVGLVDYFCSCDDRLVRKARQQQDLKVKVVSPLEFAQDLIS